VDEINFTANFLSPGDYTVAFTCQVLDDMADQDDDLIFAESQNVSVVDGQETMIVFGN